MHRLHDVLRRLHLVYGRPGDSVHDVAIAMTEAGVGAVPVLERGQLVGIFSERDLMTRVVVAGRDPEQTRVGEVMTRDVVTAEPDETVDQCLDKMRRTGCRHLPVVVKGAVISMVSLRQLLRDEIAEQDDEIRNLRAYLHQTPA